MNESKEGRTRLYFEIQKLRVTAAALYDLGKAQNLPMEKIQESILPVVESLAMALKTAAREDIGGVVVAIRMLESQADAHRKDASFLIDKAQETMAHAQSLKAALTARMKSMGEESVTDGDFSAVLTKACGKEILTLR